MGDHFINFQRLEEIPYFPVGVNNKTTASIRRANPRDVMQVVFIDLMALSPSGAMPIGQEVTFDWLLQYLVPVHVKRVLGLGDMDILYVPLVETAIASQAPEQHEQLLRVFSYQKLALERLLVLADRCGLPRFVIVPDYELYSSFGLSNDLEFVRSNYLGRKEILASKLAKQYASLQLLFVEETGDDNLHDHIGLRGEPCGMNLAHCCPSVVDFVRKQYKLLARYFFLQPGSYSEVGKRNWAGLAQDEEVRLWKFNQSLGHRVSIKSTALVHDLWPDLSGKEVTSIQMRNLLYGAISSMYFCQLAEEIFNVPLDLPSPLNSWDLSKQITEGVNVFQLSLERQIAVYAIWRAHCYPFALWLHEQLSVNAQAAEDLTQRLIRSDKL